MTRVTLVRIYAGLFVVSTAFPIAASLMPAEFVSRGVGLLDVGVAFVLLATGIYIVSSKPSASPENDHRAVAWYKNTSSVSLALLVVFFIAGSYVRWEVLLPGLAWRAWLFWYSLPAVLAWSKPVSSQQWPH
jgi:hypothetical protein